MKIRQSTGYNKQVRWQIDFGVVKGKRKQRRFDSEKAAEKELRKLQKQQENEGKAAIAKTRTRRIVTISENLAAWLERATCRLHRQVAPVGWLVKRRAALLKKAKISVWPHDVLRHSFASYHLAQQGSAEKTSLQLGHHNTQMLFAHYRELVRPAEAVAFWELKP